MSTTERLRGAATGAGGAAQAKRSILDYLQDAKVQQGLAAVAGRYWRGERMLRLCVNAVKRTPRLLECNPTSVLGAMMASAALGLEPNTVQQQAFLIPYARRTKDGDQWVTVYDCQFQVGARGFVTLAYRNQRVRRLFAEAIHGGDRFEHQLGSGAFLRYAKALSGRGDLVGAFSYVELTDGSELACVLPLDEIEKIRGKSETYRSLLRNVEAAGGFPAEASTERPSKELAAALRSFFDQPWVHWADDMAAKSAIKKHAKQLPVAANDALAAAAELDDLGESRTIDLSGLVDPDAARAAADEGAIPRLEGHDPESFEFTGGGREREPVARGGQQQPAAKSRGQQQGGKTGGAAQKQAGPGAELSLDELASKLERAKTNDEADQIIDLARHLNPDAQQVLRDIRGRLQLA